MNDIPLITVVANYILPVALSIISIIMVASKSYKSTKSLRILGIFFLILSGALFFISYSSLENYDQQSNQNTYTIAKKYELTNKDQIN